jgi:hypothetical protein
MAHARAALALWFLLAAGCGSGSAKSGGGGHPGTDAGGDRSTIPIHVPGDAAADSRAGDATAGGCCTMDGTTLHMSWACYCAAYGCETGASAHTCGPSLMWSSACGLRIRSWNTAGGVNQEVFDGTGALVGIRLASDVAQYGCTGADGGTALVVQAGQFPPASCAAQPCVCLVDGSISCPTPDGG